MRLKLSREELAKMIDSTNVKATATKEEIERLCKEANSMASDAQLLTPFM